MVVVPATPTVSNRGHAVIDWEVHASDEDCFVSSEEQGGRRDLLRAAESPEGTAAANWALA
jgi:hypothetical protein